MQPIYQREISDLQKQDFENEMFNKKFNHLRVLGISNITDNRRRLYLICLCDCGKIFTTRKDLILSNLTKSCCRYSSREEEIVRFKEQIEIDKNECWLWKGSRYKRSNGKKSYGRFSSSLFPKEVLAHRISFLLFKGFIPIDIFVCHVCDIENCVNPNHLFLGSEQMNNLDKVLKLRQARGETHGFSKLKEQDVLDIRKSHSEGLSINELIVKFNSSKTNIHGIIKRERWKHI